MPAVPAAPPLADAVYQSLTRAVLDGIEAQIDAWLSDDVIDIDSHRSGGLLELSFPNGSKVIINTQPPLQELWLAARAGGYHFRHVEGRWIDTREGTDFFELLSRVASEQGACVLSFKA